MNSKDTISKGPKKRDPTCFETQLAIIIPKGTILRQEPGQEGTFSCPVAFGKFTIKREAGNEHDFAFRKVVA